MASYPNAPGLVGDEDYDSPVSSIVEQHSEATPPAVLLVTAGYDHTIRFWDVVTGVCTNTLQYNLSVHRVH